MGVHFPLFAFERMFMNHDQPRSQPVDAEELREQRRKEWQGYFESAVAQAADAGFEVTVESVPLKPLAMRNKKSVVTVTSRR